MNEALDQALRENGIESFPERTAFALSIGVSEVTLRRWIKGKNRPHRYFQKAVAKKLGVSREELWPK